MPAVPGLIDLLSLPEGPRSTALISLVLLVISGWLGGKMVYEYGVAVAGTNEPPRR
jgi:hypothetical protein